MQKSLTMLILAILAYIPLWSASLTVVHPNGDEELLLGMAAPITWKADGVNQKIKLLLVRSGGAIVGTIASDLDAGSQSYVWSAGHYQGGIAAAGSNYKVRIKAIGDTLQDESDTAFTLFAGSPSPQLGDLAHTIKLNKKPILQNAELFSPIIITSPQANNVYTAGKPMPISWNKDFGFTSAIRMYLLDDQGAELEQKYPLANSGSYDGWTPDLKYTWPGRKFRIKLEAVNPVNHNVSSGQSGLFSIAPPPVLKKVTRTIARNGTTATTQTRQYQDEGTADCLSASHPLPGRVPGAPEIKVGHHVASGRHGECDWYEAYYFQGCVTFDLDEIKGKEIIEAKLLVSLTEFLEQGPQGTLATNEECDSNCDVYVKDSGFPGGLLTSFSIFSVAGKKSLDVTRAVQHWAGNNPNQGLLFRARLDHSNYSESICLKYYGTMFLTVKYIDYE